MLNMEVCKWIDFEDRINIHLIRVSFVLPRTFHSGTYHTMFPHHLGFSVCSCHSIEWLSSILRRANLVLNLGCYQAQEMRAIINFEAKDQACVLESCCQKISKIMSRNKNCLVLEWPDPHSTGPTQTPVHLERGNIFTDKDSLQISKPRFE